ncbi:VWA domain-containing protein [bacterium]|nr:VWA domain-containing protein [bacterium]
MNLITNQPHAWIYLIALVASVVSVRWFYRCVPETVSRPLRLLLAVLRSVALALLVVLLMEPVLSLSRVARERPVIGVLVDRSRSMAMEDATAGARRGDEAVALLNEVVLPKIGRDAELVAFSFAGDVRPLDTTRSSVASPAAFDGELTDIAKAFEHLGAKLSGRNLGAVVIATDGASNLGGSPYEAGRALGVPVFTFGVGESDAGVDIAVREATTNRVSYAGESLPIRTRVSSSGYADGEAVIELRENDVILDSRAFSLSQSGEEVEVMFRVTPTEPGIHHYTISVPPASGETLVSNNRRVAVTNVFKGRIRVLLAAPRPSWDLSFIRRELEGDPNVELTAVIELAGASRGHSGSPASGSGNGPGSREELFEHDLVVLVEPSHGVPMPGEWLSEYVRGRGGGLLLVGLPDLLAESNTLADLLPFVVGDATADEHEQRVRLTAAGVASPVVRIVSDRTENTRAWSSLPPVWTTAPRAWSASPDAATLAVAGSGRDEVPVVVAARRGAGSVMVVAVEGVWRWELANRADAGFLDRLVANAARWLTARGELERVVVEADRDVYAAGESAVISAQVYREDFRPATGADVVCTIARGVGAAPIAEFALEPDGDFYRGGSTPLAPGRYLFEATTTLGGEKIGTGRGEFIVEEFSLEDSEIRRRSTLLARLGDESGGGYYMPETLDEFPDAVPLEWSARSVTRELELWSSPWLLAAFVVLLGAEWALRRSKGLP